MLNPWIEACELRELALKKELKPREIAEFFLSRIERLNPRFDAFTTVTAERALDDAGRLEKMTTVEAATLPLFGVPYSIKDLTWTKGIRTTMGSKSFENFVPDDDAEYYERIINAGGIMLGKTATPEFGGRPTTEGGLCPPARNPWNPAHTAGGSSGGAAAALAAGMGPIAEGSDGGGSIRIPSACCGLVGLKPSRSRVSFAPFFGEQWAGFATSGPMARSVRDAALLLDVMAGAAIGDPYFLPPPAPSFAEAAKARPKNLRLAAICETALGPVDSEVRTAFERACDDFRAMGHRVETIQLDPAAMLRDQVGIVIAANVASLPVPKPELMDPAVRSSWDAGHRISAPDYINAVHVVHNTSRRIIQTLHPYNALLTPTLTRPAVPIGSMPSSMERIFEEFFAWIPFTFPFNATGQPAISLPNGLTRNGLPIGLQIVGRPADETGVIALAAAFEQARPWRGQHPPLD